MLFSIVCTLTLISSEYSAYAVLVLHLHTFHFVVYVVKLNKIIEFCLTGKFFLCFIYFVAGFSAIKKL